MSIEKLTGLPGEIPIEFRLSGSKRLSDQLQKMFEAMDLESLEHKDFPLSAFRISGRMEEKGLWKMTVKLERYEKQDSEK